MPNLITYEFSRDWDKLEIYPLNDLHIGDAKTDVVLFQHFKKFILDQENRFIILNGDLMNNAIKSSVSNVYKETLSPHEQKKWLIRELKPLSHRILAITSGNHENRTKKEADVDLMEDIAMALNLENVYSDECVFVKVSFGRLKVNQKMSTYVIHAIHGAGGGKMIGSALNNLESYGMSYEGIDIFLMGHVHGRVATRSNKIIIDPRNNVIYEKEILYVVASAWQDFGGYAMKNMLRPRCKGKTPISLYGREKKFEVII